ncbi:hypothetical protein BOPE631_00390 [Bordetella pertussis]|nr:hypothetical protein BBB37_13420 [Bordetella pertussis]PNO98418.1 hypothetical protein AL465_005755 [Bordetella pertussis 18323]
MNWGVGDFQFLKSGSDEPCIQPIESSQLDHDNAARLAAGLDGIDGVRVLGQHTNMVFAEFDPARCESLTTALRGQGILMRAVYGGPTRLVTHLDVDADGIDRVVDAVRGHCAAAR